MSNIEKMRKGGRNTSFHGNKSIVGQAIGDEAVDYNDLVRHIKDQHPSKTIGEG
jgi:hypothetical protein